MNRTGHQMHAGMEAEDADELELPIIGGGLSNTAGIRQPLSPVTSSDSLPMSNCSPRHGGDSDRESEIVSEASSDQEQSDPLSVEGEAAGHQVNAGMEKEDACDPRISVRPAAPCYSPLPHLIPPAAPCYSPHPHLIPPSKQNPKRPPPPDPCYSQYQAYSARALPHLMPYRALGFADDDGLVPISVAGAGPPIRNQIAGLMKTVIFRRLKEVTDQAKMIYRVPRITRSSDEDAYAAQFVSFGPYNIDNVDLKSANKHKWSFLQQILNMNKKVPLEKYLEEMDRVKQDVNGCYAITQKMEIEMILLDGCCILGFLGILQQVEDQIQKQDKVVVKANTVDNEMRPTVDSTNASLLPSSRLPQPEVGAQTHQEKDKVEAEARTVQKYLSVDNTMGEDALGQSSTVSSVKVRLPLKEEPKRTERTVDSTGIKLWHHDSIRHDLLLMENQLPFFVLQKIFDLATAGTPVQGSLILIDMVNQGIRKLLACYPLVATEQSFHHLLHCCHLKFRPSMANSSSSNSNPPAGLQPWRGATDLYKAGIKFKPKQCDPSESLLDVKLVSGRTLMIPTLIIEDSTSSVFRNLIAFEQSCAHENYFTAYAFFMGELMRTPEDVTLLVKTGVVENHIGADNEVSDFFNNLIKGVGFDVNGKHFLSSTLEELKNSYNSVGQRQFADLKQNYFRSPWLVISVVAAAIVLVCTVVQTVFAMIK